MTHTPSRLVADIPEHVYQRVIAHADRDETTGCLVSRYSVGSHGYAQFGVYGTVVLAHRGIWIYHHGAIPEGMTVDHRQGKCSQKCIEIKHLRLISNYENARRNNGANFPFGQCQHGHPDSMLKLYKRKGKMSLGCSECRRKMQRRYRARKKAGLIQ